MGTPNLPGYYLVIWFLHYNMKVESNPVSMSVRILDWARKKVAHKFISDTKALSKAISSKLVRAMLTVVINMIII